MKKIISLLLAALMVLSMVACASAGTDETTAPSEETTEAPNVNVPGSALEVLENIWNDYAEEEKFSVIGGNMENPVDGAPGNYDLAYAENMTYNLLVPAERLADVTEAASMIHMMNANTFTCGVFRLAEGVEIADFAGAMESAVMNNQWMCGFPETLVVASIGGEYVLVAFGVNDAMNPFQTHLDAVYPEADKLYVETIG